VRVIYFGSSSFSVPPLKSILPLVSCVVTRKAKPKGRGYQIEVNDVKRIAAENEIPVIELDSFRDDTARQLEQYNPDFLVVASFGLIVPKWLLEMPSIGPVNIHPSLLPKYRGPSPIQWALWNGEKETGNTFIKMNEKMDQGDILYQETMKIDTTDDMVTLSERLASRAGEVLPDFMRNLTRDEMAKGTVQEETEATYTPIITKEMGKIDWTLGALEVMRQVKALVLWPTAYTYLDGVMLKVFGARIYDPEAAGEAGLISDIVKEGVVVHTPNGALLINEVQLENRKRLKAYQFAQGYRGLVGKRLG
jgi:methionyl-tRNA formyltransferase